MIVGRWYVQLAAVWHWYLPLRIYITFCFVFCFDIVSVHSFLKIFFFNLVSIRTGRRYQHVLALCALLTGKLLKGLTILNFCV